MNGFKEQTGECLVLCPVLQYVTISIYETLLNLK